MTNSEMVKDDIYIAEFGKINDLNCLSLLLSESEELKIDWVKKMCSTENSTCIHM